MTEKRSSISCVKKTLFYPFFRCSHCRGNRPLFKPVNRIYPNERGFALIELMIAMIISSFAITMLYESAKNLLSAGVTSAGYAEAISLARSHLETVGHGSSIAIEQINGVDGEGFSWTMRVWQIGSRVLSLSDQERARDSKPSVARLFFVQVVESWKTGGSVRRVTLDTKRVDIRRGE